MSETLPSPPSVRPLSDYATGKAGIVSCLTWRSTGGYFGLTARHLLGDLSSIIRSDSDPYASATLLLDGVPLNKRAAQRQTSRRTTHLADPVDSLGETVYRINLHARIPGTLIGVGTTIELALSTGSAILAHGLISIDFGTPVAAAAGCAPSTQLPLDATDSGALITTADDEFIGVLVARDGCIGFAVPLIDYVAETGLSISAFLPENISTLHLSSALVQNLEVDAERARGADIDVQFEEDVA